jgi:hypothetical protein
MGLIMRAHIIENSTVVNTVEVDSLAHPDGLLMVAATAASDIGWSYIDGQFVDNRPIPEVVPMPALSKEELLAQLAALSAQIQALE